MTPHPQARLPSATRIGAVHYTVADLDRQIAFYTRILGFRLRARHEQSASLGTDTDELLRFTVHPGAHPAQGRTTGLYHTAFLLPTRRDLAHLFRRIAESRTPIDGTSNHGTHLAIYLPDAEGNGVELAWDFPRDRWPMRDGMMDFERMPRAGIDLPALMAEIAGDPAPWPGLSPGTQVGHVHLHVAHLAPTERFYHELLGFDITLKHPRFGAEFFSAGGYHHHVGTNIWNGAGAPPPPADATGLRWFSLVLPSTAEVERLGANLQAAGVAVEPHEGGLLTRDPSQNGVLLQAG